jgi:hypothetical protein
MSAEAIYNVTVALRDRLKAAVTRPGHNGSVFVGPPNEVASGAELILFLYRVCPSATLRNREHRVASTGPKGSVVYRNSLPFDLYFLITVGATPAPGEEPLLSSLGYAIQALQLDPNLVGAPVGQETIRVTIEPLSTEESSRIWNLFPASNYRTSVAYVASPVWIDPPQPEIEAPPVTTDSLNAGASEATQ